MQVFEAGRVHFVEGDPGFYEETALSRQRGVKAFQTVQAKTENLLRLVAAVEISLPDWSEAQLVDYFWHPGIRPARTVLRRRMLCAATEQFPHLGSTALEWAKKEKGNAEIELVLV